MNALTALTGSRMVFTQGKPPPINHPPEFLAVWRSPWQRLLKRWDYGPNVNVRFNHYGAFFHDKWAKDLSGVLIIHRSYRVQWFPNPFAAESIREVRLLDLGLSLAQSGAAHPATLAAAQRARTALRSALLRGLRGSEGSPLI